jgi:hypothetical protein
VTTSCVLAPLNASRTLGRAGGVVGLGLDHQRHLRFGSLSGDHERRAPFHRKSSLTDAHHRAVRAADDPVCERNRTVDSTLQGVAGLVAAHRDGAVGCARQLDRIRRIRALVRRLAMTATSGATLAARGAALVAPHLGDEAPPFVSLGVDLGALRVSPAVLVAGTPDRPQAERERSEGTGQLEKPLGTFHDNSDLGH